MKKCLSVLGILSAFSFYSTAGVASNPWTGVYGGIGFGFRSVGTSEKKGEPKEEKAKGFSYGLELGGGAAVADYLYLGLNLYLDFGKTKTKKTESEMSLRELDDRLPDVLASTQMSDSGKNLFNGTVQIGVPLCNFMPFIEVGYGTGKYEEKISLAAHNANGIIKLSSKASGPIYGIGIKYMPMKNIVTSLGYRYSSFKSKNCNLTGEGTIYGQPLSGSGRTRLKNKYTSHAFLASVSYLFNF
jgi:opacity protein-like surface antigen